MRAVGHNPESAFRVLVRTLGGVVADDPLGYADNQRAAWGGGGAQPATAGRTFPTAGNQERGTNGWRNSTRCSDTGGMPMA